MSSEGQNWLGRQAKYSWLWLRRFIQWLGEALLFWIGAGVLVLALGSIWQFGHSEPAVRVAGLVLQLLGIATVMLGIRKTRRLFGHSGMFMAARSWLARFPHYGVRTASVSLAASVGSASAVGSACVRAGKGDGSVEARLSALESDMNGAYASIGRVQADLTTATTEHASAIEREQADRQAGDESVRAIVESTQTGGLSLSVVGAVWLFAGVLLSTIAPEIARTWS